MEHAIAAIMVTMVRYMPSISAGRVLRCPATEPTSSRRTLPHPPTSAPVDGGPQRNTSDIYIEQHANATEGLHTPWPWPLCFFPTILCLVLDNSADSTYSHSLPFGWAVQTVRVSVCLVMSWNFSHEIQIVSFSIPSSARSVTLQRSTVDRN